MSDIPTCEHTYRQFSSLCSTITTAFAVSLAMLIEYAILLISIN